MSLDWMQSCFELEAMEVDFKDCQGSTKYTQEKFAQVQFELMDRIGKYEDLNKKYIELENRLMEIVKEESQRKGFKAIKAELAVKKNEIKSCEDKNLTRSAKRIKSIWTIS
jgi:predicted nuclease with TOPRIM domain